MDIQGLQLMQAIQPDTIYDISRGKTEITITEEIQRVCAMSAYANRWKYLIMRATKKRDIYIRPY